MPTPEIHTNIAAPVASGVLSWVFTALFDIPPELVFVAFIGTLIGLLLREPLPVYTTKAAALWQLVKTIGTLVIATILTSWLISLTADYTSKLSQTAVSGLAGAALVYYQVLIKSLVQSVLERIFGKVGA